MTKRKFSPAQIAAQKRFAAMAKAGKFRKRTKRKTVKRNVKTNPRVDTGRSVIIADNGVEFPYELERRTVRNRAKTGKRPYTSELTGSIVLYSPGKQSYSIHSSFEKAKVRANELAPHYVGKNPVKSGARRSPPKRNPKEKYPVLKLRPGEGEAIMRIAERAGRSVQFGYENDKPVTVSGHYTEMKAVRRALADIRKTKRNPRKRQTSKFVIRASRPVKSGYLYYYLRGDQFVKDAKHADKYAKDAGEKHMRAILPKLPRAIASITLVKA